MHIKISIYLHAVLSIDMYKKLNINNIEITMGECNNYLLFNAFIP